MDNKNNIYGINTEKNKESIDNSINKLKIKVEKNKKKITKISFKNRTIAVIAASFVLGTTFGAAAKSGVDYLGERISVVSSAKDEQDKYKSIVSDNTYSNINEKGEHTYWYDTDNMALSVSSLEDDFEMEKAVYGVYSNMNANKEKRFNEFLCDLSRYVDDKSYFYSLKGTSDALSKYMDDKGFDISEDLGYEKYISELKIQENKKTGGMKI